jgi:protein-disulfide isomerase
MPGVAAMSGPEIDLFWRMAQLLPSPCGRAQSLWEARQDAKCQARAWRALRYVKGLIQEGDLSPEIQEKYAQRYRCKREKLETTGLPSRGRGDATVTLVEFSDFECPRCRAAEPALRRLLEKYERVKFVFVHYPLVKVHAHAEMAARAAVAAGQQGAFWGFHDLLYQVERPLDLAMLLELAQGMKLDMGRFRADMATAREQVDRQRQMGDRLNLKGTPTFYVNGCQVQETEVSKLEGWVLDALD